MGLPVSSAVCAVDPVYRGNSLNINYFFYCIVNTECVVFDSQFTTISSKKLGLMELIAAMLRYHLSSSLQLFLFLVRSAIVGRFQTPVMFNAKDKSHMLTRLSSSTVAASTNTHVASLLMVLQESSCYLRIGLVVTGGGVVVGGMVVVGNFFGLNLQCPIKPSAVKLRSDRNWIRS